MIGASFSFLKYFPPEMAHFLTIKILKFKPSFINYNFEEDYRLNQHLWGLDFKNPIGLAAGFDKNAEISNQMLGLGFGFVETGTATPLPQLGNPKPRLYRLNADQAVINRLGFNNKGSSIVAKNLAQNRNRKIH